jgi:hypothetical protein
MRIELRSSLKRVFGGAAGGAAGGRGGAGGPVKLVIKGQVCFGPRLVDNITLRGAERGYHVKSTF